jgi:hypothetical protein
MSDATVRAPGLPPTPARREGPVAALGRAIALLLVPAAIVPVLLLGPGLLRAPQRLYRQARAEVQRIEIALAPARVHHPGPERAMRMSLRWSAGQVSLARVVRELERT